MPDAFRNTPGYLIHENARLLNRVYDRRMSALGMTRAQWWVLAKLYFNDDVTQTELAAELGFSKAALGALLDRLEGNGWIQRRQHPTDRRARRVLRTPKAEAVMAEMRSVAVAMNRNLIRGLSRAEHATLVHLLQRVRDNLTD
jgi:MarR family transcriptional regulator for hemolysin